MTNRHLFLVSLLAIVASWGNPHRVISLLWTPSWDAGAISQYDRIIRQVAADKGYDWRLVAAIANTESEFKPDVVSSNGAVGLMQIMPAVALQFDVDTLDITDPYINVELGVDFLDYLFQSFRFPARMPENDRLSIVLASYNCGLGHVFDARRLAVKYGENHNSWRVVAKYLELKSEPAYYEDEVVQCGEFNDSPQTIRFVYKVLRNYDNYCQSVAL